MKNSRRILALFGAIFLFCLYGSTLVFAFIDKSATMGLLKISVAATIFLPVLLYAFTLVYRLSHKHDVEESVDDSQ